MIRPMIGLLLLGLAGPAVAQEDGGWDLATDAGNGRTVVASVTYESGAGVAVQCHDGRLSTAIMGLPAAHPGEIDAQGRRALTVTLDNEPVSRGWKAPAGATVAVAVMPGSLARRLRQGGTLSVTTIPHDSGAPVRRLELSLPRDTDGVNRALTACGAPIVSDHDAIPLLEPDMLTADIWRRGRLFTPPPGEVGQVDISCIFAPEGRVRDCQTESESSPGLGARIIRGQRRVHFPLDEDTARAVEGRLIYFTVVQVEVENSR